MSDWEQLKDDIYDYVDGLLPSEARKAVARQIESNPEAGAFYREVVALRVSLKGLKHIQPPSDFDTVLRTRITMERSMNRQGLFAGSLRLPAAATIGALAVAALLLVFNLTNSELQTNQTVISSSPVGTAPDDRVAAPPQPAINYVPADPMDIDTRGTKLERLTSARDYTSRDSLRLRAQERRIRTVEF